MKFIYCDLFRNRTVGTYFNFGTRRFRSSFHGLFSIISSTKIIVEMLKRGNTFEESVERKALKWTRTFEERRHIYALILGPIFDVQRLLGRAPFYRDKNGSKISILLFFHI